MLQHWVRESSLCFEGRPEHPRSVTDAGNAPRRKGWIVAVVALLGLVATYVWQRSRPVFDLEEVADARAALDLERQELLQLTCNRSGMGDGAPTDQDGFDAAVFGERWAECRRLAAETFEAVWNEAGHNYDWQLERGDGANLPPEVANPNYLRLYPPPARSDCVDAAEAACGGLAETIERLVASTDLCTPLRPTASGWDDVVDLVPVIWFFKAVALEARRAYREDRPFEGLRLLANAIALARDVRRGPANLILAMVSVAAEGILVAHTVSLLIADPGLSRTEYAAIDEILATILSEPIGAHWIWRAERNTFADLIEPDPEASDLLTMTASGLDLSWCPQDAGVETCLEGLMNREPLSDGPPSEARMLVLGHRGARAATLRWAQEELLQTYPRYLGRLVAADTDLAMLRTALAWTEARGLGSECPPEVPEQQRRAPGSDELVEVVFQQGDVYEMRAPGYRVSSDIKRTVFQLACPAATATWADADGNPVKPLDDVQLGEDGQLGADADGNPVEPDWEGPEEDML